ncbi:MAG TPA: hypothetical protein VHZ55_31545 [Bryobacteraceae bacterium]|jgi:hypothetical protein|nr:hypothetical protein [Bryobacteraceae bacterium]
MTQETTDGADDLERLKRRFEEFRSTQTSRGRLPARLWKEAAEVAKSYGLNPTAEALRLDYNRLKQRMAAVPDRAKRSKKEAPVPAFVELIGPGSLAITECHVEVESEKGAKLRLELKGVATTELASLIRAFVGQ